ncbi:MAG TPA: xylan 1,4-beta-xylosidase, partial [Allosphingosinicella sp.]
QTLLEPVEWTADGWPQPFGGDLSSPIAKPANLRAQQHGTALSDDFSRPRFGIQWAFYSPGPDEMRRVRLSGDRLHMRAKGVSPADASPLCCIAGDQRYRVEVDVDVDEGAEAGLLLFYNRRLYAGLGFDERRFIMHRYGLSAPRGGSSSARSMRIRLTNDRNILTMHTSPDAGATWRKFDVQMEVSGYHHNVAYDFLSLRPALYAAGSGEARFSNFTYRALT